MYAEGAGRSGVGKIEVEVENVCLADAQFAADDVHQHVASLHLVGHHSQNGQHVLLLAQLHTVVHLAVEVYGKVAYLQQRTLDVQQ